VAIQALDEQWSATAAGNDLEGTVSFYSDDAVLLPPKRAGRDRSEVDQGFLGEPARPNKAVSRTVSKAEIATSGELGYLYGTYSLSIGGPNGGAPVRDTGKLVEIWKKQADGKWKCIVDTYNFDLAVPAPEVKK